MVESERLALAIALDHELGELFVLLHNDRQILVRQARRIILGADDRLHRKLAESEVEHDLDVLEKVRICMRKSAAHVVVFAASGLHEFLELRHDLLPAAVAREIDAETVVDFFSAVERKHDIAAFAVRKLDHIVIDEHAVRGQRETEGLALLLLDGSRIRDEVLNDLEIHERFAAEKVNFEVPSGARILDQKIEGAFADFEAHHRALAVVLTLRREAVGAVQVTGVRDVQAQCFYHAGSPGLQLARHRLVRILREKLTGVLQIHDLIIAGADLLRVAHFGARVLFLHLEKHSFRECFDVDHAAGFPVVFRVEFLLVRVDLFESRDNVVGKVIHDMEGAGANVQHDVIAAKFVLMNHRSP